MPLSIWVAQYKKITLAQGEGDLFHVFTVFFKCSLTVITHNEKGGKLYILLGWTSNE